jgi:hypothetical protein
MKKLVQVPMIGNVAGRKVTFPKMIGKCYISLEFPNRCVYQICEAEKHPNLLYVIVSVPYRLPKEVEMLHLYFLCLKNSFNQELLETIMKNHVIHPHNEN